MNTIVSYQNSDDFEKNKTDLLFKLKASIQRFRFLLKLKYAKRYLQLRIFLNKYFRKSVFNSIFLFFVWLTNVLFTILNEITNKIKSFSLFVTLQLTKITNASFFKSRIFIVISSSFIGCLVFQFVLIIFIPASKAYLITNYPKLSAFISLKMAEIYSIINLHNSEINQFIQYKANKAANLQAANSIETNFLIRYLADYFCCLRDKIDQCIPQVLAGTFILILSRF